MTRLAFLDLSFFFFFVLPSITILAFFFLDNVFLPFQCLLCPFCHFAEKAVVNILFALFGRVGKNRSKQQKVRFSVFFLVFFFFLVGMDRLMLNFGITQV